jgi:hypothetical protein
MEFVRVEICFENNIFDLFSTSSVNKWRIREWAYTNLWIYQRWDHVPWRSKLPLLTGQTRCEAYFDIR